MKRRRIASNRLNEYRIATGLSYKTLATASGASDSTIERYLNKNCSYDSTLLQNIITAINTARIDKGLNPIVESDIIAREETTLSDCLADFLSWSPLDHTDKLSMNIIALDMNYGWENLLRAFSSTKASQVDVKLLMLDSCVIGDESDPMITSTVLSWCKAADGQYSLLQKLVKSYADEHRIRLEVRRYTSMPTYHGVRAETDTEVRHYVTRCAMRNLRVPDFGWGEREYLILPDSDTTELAERTRVAFNSRFNETWMESTVSRVFGIP